MKKSTKNAKAKTKKSAIDDALGDSFVYVLRERPKLEIQILDESPEESRVMLKRVMIGFLVLYKAACIVVKRYLEK